MPRLIFPVVAAVLAGVSVAVGINTWVVTITQVDSQSMAPTLEAGETVAVAKLSQVKAFDIVAFDGRGTFIPRDHAEVTFVKRVIGMPGDRVRCCDESGRTVVNGVALSEEYVAAGNVDDLQFDVIVPPRKVWVMGDNRAASTDSRAFLGAPGGGFVPLDRVAGTVVGVIAPLGEARWVAVAGGLGAGPSASARVHS